MLKAKESKGVGGGKRGKKSTHVRFFLPSSPPPPDLDDDDDDDDAGHHFAPSSARSPPSSSSSTSTSLSSSTSSLQPPARAYPSPYSTSSSSSSSTSSQPPRRSPPAAPSLSSSSSSSSSSRPPHRPPPTAPSSSSSLPSSSSSSSSRVRLPPASFSYLAPPSALGSSTSAASTPRGGSSSTAFFAPPPTRPLLSTSSSSAASLPGSSSSASGMIGAGGWTRYRSAVDRASAAAAVSSSASTAGRRPSPPPPRWRDDTDVSSAGSSSSDEDRTLTDAATNTASSSAASPPPPSMSATEGEVTTDGEITHPSLSSAMSSGVSSSSSSSSSSFGHSPVPSLSSPVSSPYAPAVASSTSPRRAPSPLASSYQPPRLPRPAPPAPIEPAPTSFACARPFGDVKDVDDVAAALEAWLIPPASSRGAASNKKKTKIRFGVEVGRLSQPRCSLRVSHLTGTEGRRARKWADVRSNSVAVSFAFTVKEGVNVFELGELSGSIKNLLLLVGSDELDTDLESKLVDEGPGTSKILLLNLLFGDECLFRAISAVLAHHRIEQADASLLLSQSPADCRSRRARLEGIDARLVVDAVIGRSILGFVEELVANLRREAAPPASTNQQENENEERERRRSESEKRREGGTRRHRATKEEKRRVAGAMLRKYGQQLLGIPPSAAGGLGLGDVDAITRLVHLLRALNDIRFFVEFDSLDELIRRLWPTTGTADNGGDAGPRRSVSEEGELLGAGATKKTKKAKEKAKTKKNETTEEEAKRKKKTKEKKKKRLSGSASKRQSADTARHRRNSSSSSSSSRRRDAVDPGDDEAQQWESYSWHSLHAYLLASYEQLVRQTTAAAGNVDSDDDGDGHDVDSGGGARPRDMGREIEEGIVASVRDMMLKLQSLSTIHSVRAIAGDDVLLVACESMELFAVLPSPDEMVAIERAAKSEARRRKKKNESEAKKKKEEERRKKKTKEMGSGGGGGASVRSPPAAAAVSSTPGISGMPSRPLPPPKRDKVNIKIMVLGDLRVGKTSLIQRFLRGSAFTMPKYKPTYAADFVHKNVVLRDKPRTLQIWDTSGNERQRAPDRAFFKGVDALVLVFDQRRASTFAPALDRHLDDFLAHAACPDPRLLPVVVIGNRAGEKNESEAAGGGTGKSESESEGGGEREVRRSEVEAWCRGRIEGNRLFAYFEASAKEGAHVDDAFLHAANAVLDVHHGALH